MHGQDPDWTPRNGEASDCLLVSGRGRVPDNMEEVANEEIRDDNELSRITRFDGSEKQSLMFTACLS